MENHEIAGYIAAGSSLLISGVGMPMQIMKTRRTGERVSKILAGATTLSYVAWSSYGWLKPDYFIAASQTFGFAMGSIILFQSFQKGKFKK